MWFGFIDEVCVNLLEEVGLRNKLKNWWGVEGFGNDDVLGMVIIEDLVEVVVERVVVGSDLDILVLGRL